MTWSPSSATVVDLADADAGDADLVVGLEAAGLGEVGVVGVAAADQRQVWARKAARISTRDDGEADAPIDDGVALAERSSSLVHPRSHLSEPVCSRPGRLAAGQLDRP